MMNYASPFTGYTGLARELLEVNPNNSYQMGAGAQGAAPTSPNQNFYNYASGLGSYFQNDFYNQSAKEPGLKWLDYLDTVGSSRCLNEMWSGLSPRQRGEQSSPNLQWQSGPFGQMR